ncbi:MAG: DUF881 domain-containing protein [Micromonosporaceae bacterium]|nr:DUF881 domain-containing protein [Micromonosporaceae bacterium]
MTSEPTEQGDRRFAPDFLLEMFRNPLDAGYAEAARARASSGPPSPRRRGIARGARTVALVFAGFLLAVAYQQTVANEPASARARAGLVADVQQRQVEADKLQRQADGLRDRVNRERDAALAAGGADAGALQGLEAGDGLARVRGAGVTVELGDAPQPVDPVTGQATGKNEGKVLDRDLQDVTNELWRDGAEAIAVNGERLTATSTIRNAGATILVNFKPVVSPYQILAIGPKDLDRRFNDSDTGQRFHRYVTEFAMQVSVRASSDLTLPAAADPQLRFARPVPSGSPSPAVPSPSASGGR